MNDLLNAAKGLPYPLNYYLLFAVAIAIVAVVLAIVALSLRQVFPALKVGHVGWIAIMIVCVGVWILSYHLDAYSWRTEVHGVDYTMFRSDMPLVGIDYELESVGDGRMGLGIPFPLLSPSIVLLGLLRPQPTDELVCLDADGAGLALVTWRTDFDHSDYHLPMVRTSGCGVAIRPDLLDTLITQLGARFVLRDSVTAAAELAGLTRNSEVRRAK